jgi:hypothetical protein
MFEKRGIMSGGKSLASTLWLTASLALLASVLIAPTRTSGFAAVSSRPDSLPPNLAPSPTQPTTHLGAAMATDVVPRVNALPSDDEEEEDRADAQDEPRVSFPILCSFRTILDRQTIAPRSILSRYPLRC